MSLRRRTYGYLVRGAEGMLQGKSPRTNTNGAQGDGLKQTAFLGEGKAVAAEQVSEQTRECC